MGRLVSRLLASPRPFFAPLRVTSEASGAATFQLPTGVVKVMRHVVATPIVEEGFVTPPFGSRLQVMIPPSQREASRGWLPLAADYVPVIRYNPVTAPRFQKVFPWGGPIRELGLWDWPLEKMMTVQVSVVLTNDASAGKWGFDVLGHFMLGPLFEQEGDRL